MNNFSSPKTYPLKPETCHASLGRGSRGVTLLDTVVGTALMLVVFLGIAGAFRLSIDVVSNNKARSGAIALAGERMEYIRSIAYGSIGTVGGIPAGSIAQSETIVLNAVTYTRRTVVQYMDDPKDGLGASDTNGIISDYKTAKVDVAWTSRTGTRHITLVSRFEPPSGMEIACTPPCGTLVIHAVDAVSSSVSGASVSIMNTSVSPAVNINTFTNASGTTTFIGAPAGPGYAIVVTKPGYSTAQTYSVTAGNTNPNPGHLTVADGQTTVGTFAIDLLSSMTISTYSLTTNTWTDSFDDSSKVGPATSNIEVSGNRARFAGIQPWIAPADLYSQAITPVTLSRWGIFSWNDTQPSETTITYHIYYPTDSGIAIVPDSALAGNSTGFTTETLVDVGSIPAGIYPSLILGAHLVALSPQAPSPSIEDWGLTYESGQGIAIPFTLRGVKTIGSKQGGVMVYKYDQVHTTDASGTLSIPLLEWDTYTTTVNASTGYDITSSCPSQPLVLVPNSSLTVQLFLSEHTANSLLVDVKNDTGGYLSGVVVQLTKGGSYDKTIITNSCGQAFFDSLTNGNYSITASSTGYQTYSSDSVNVTDDSRFSIVLNE